MATATHHTPIVNARNLFLNREISETLSESEAHIRVPSQLPTPLIGRWADESFPLNSRQASDIVQEQAVQRQRSSVIFEDANGNEFTYGDESEPAPTGPNAEDAEESVSGCGNSELAEEISCAQGSNDDLSLSSPTHVSRCYRFDPYNLSSGGVDVMYCCYCDQCTAVLSAAAVAHNAAQATSIIPDPSISNAAAELLMHPADDLTYSQPQHHQPLSHQSASRNAPRGLGASPPDNSSASSTSYEWDAPRPKAHHAGFATHLTALVSNTPAAALAHHRAPQPSQGPLLSSFMPPPPPPRIMTFVLEEEGNRRASSIYYHILTRWYNHVVEAQEFFVAEENYCPPPSKDLYPFDEWADRVSGWWYSHFEHMQKKPSRFSVPTPAAAPASRHPNGARQQ